MDNVSDFHQRLVRLLDKDDRSQAAIGREIGLEPSSMNRLVKGKREPTVEEVLELARVLHVEPYELMPALGGKKAEPNTVPPPVPPVVRAHGKAEDEIPRKEWAEGLAHYLDRFGGRVAPDVRRELQSLQFHTEGVVLDDFFWDDQRCTFDRALGISGGTPWVERPKAGPASRS